MVNASLVSLLCFKTLVDTLIQVFLNKESHHILHERTMCKLVLCFEIILWMSALWTLNNSSCCLPYHSYDVGLENSVLDQLIITKLFLCAWYSMYLGITRSCLSQNSRDHSVVSFSYQAFLDSFPSNHVLCLLLACSVLQMLQMLQQDCTRLHAIKRGRNSDGTIANE